MSDASYLKGLLSNELPFPYIKNRLVNAGLISLVVCFLYTFAHIVEGVIPMNANDYQRLHLAIVKIANDRQITANQMWQEVFFQLRITDVSDLKKSHIDDVSEIILDEIGKTKPS